MKTHCIVQGQAHNNYCTYLNSHLLGAPREYVLHGLVSGLDCVSLRLPSPSILLVAMPNPVSCCLSPWVRFHT